MIKTKELPDGKIEVSSDTAYVSIGSGPVKTLIISKDELEYVSEEESTEES